MRCPGPLSTRYWLPPARRDVTAVTIAHGQVERAHCHPLLLLLARSGYATGGATMQLWRWESLADQSAEVVGSFGP